MIAKTRGAITQNTGWHRKAGDAVWSCAVPRLPWPCPLRATRCAWVTTNFCRADIELDLCLGQKKQQQQQQQQQRGRSDFCGLILQMQGLGERNGRDTKTPGDSKLRKEN